MKASQSALFAFMCLVAIFEDRKLWVLVVLLKIVTMKQSIRYHLQLIREYREGGYVYKIRVEINEIIGLIDTWSVKDKESIRLSILQDV